MAGRRRSGRDKFHPGNTLNDLSGREWIKFTKTWFELPSRDEQDALSNASQTGTEQVSAGYGFEQSWTVIDSKRYWQNKDMEMHPARYPEELVSEFVTFFTKAGEWVLDPFAGSGATAVACAESGRHCVGIELSERFARKAQERLAQRSPRSGCVVQLGDARDIADASFWDQAQVPDLPLGDGGLPLFDFVMTSPPYWDMLRHSRGGVKSTHKQRAEKGLETVYSEDKRDLGNISEYDEFVAEVARILGNLKGLLRPERYMVVVAQNMRSPDGEVKTFAWDLQRALSNSFDFQGERIWCQNSKALGIWGYPKIFVPNYHHHYCLIFRRPREQVGP